MADLKQVIRARAVELGFDAVGFTRVEADPDDAEHLRQYLAEGRHADMEWMARTAERRADPKALWPEARSVICLGVNYGPAENPDGARPNGSRRDQHLRAGPRLPRCGEETAEGIRRLARRRARSGVKVFVDTAPVMEKPLAMRAGLGWNGKHTNLVSRRFGSWLFLAEVFTTLELSADMPEVDHCGSCEACLRACPTDAFAEPYRIEPRRCVSYLTIEHKGDIAPELASAFGNRVYGCDDCLAACPWNKFAEPTRHVDLRPRADLAAPKLADLATMDATAFHSQFRHTTISGRGKSNAAECAYRYRQCRRRSLPQPSSCQRFARMILVEAARGGD